MSQPGHGGYGGQQHHQGQQAQQPYPPLTYQPYPIPVQSSNQPIHSSVLDHQSNPSQTYEYSPSMIPGLGLNALPNAMVWHHQQHNTLPEARHAFAEPPAPGLGGNSVSGNTDAPTLAIERTNQQRDSGMAEEGEISEGELGDAYEPNEVIAEDSANRYSPSRPHVEDAAKNTRERSGSYSPYLSPHELREPGRIRTRSNEQGINNSFIDESTHPPTHDDTQSRPFTNNRESTTPNSIGEAKKFAQDAILRLQALNVQFEDYVAEGVDRAILLNLFKDMGLDAGHLTLSEEPTRVVEAVGLSATTTSTPLERSSEPKSQQVTKSKDKSEERKDRIARLLAAKGSKATAPSSPEPQDSTANSPKASSAVLSKKLSEKSKLLHQKMEALRRSREGLEKSRQQLVETASGNRASGGDIQAPRDILDQLDSHNTTGIVSTQEPIPNDSTNGLFQSSIPGLFLTPTSSQPVNGSMVKPFGRLRASRPFLIDVSDDEDDAEMEIDSSGRRSASVVQEESPHQGTAIRQDASLHRERANNQFSSPSSTPVRSNATNDGGGRGDLAFMNKRIEEMKLKIAEAEARKKAKLFEQDSPALSQSNDKQGEDGAETKGHAKDTIHSQALPVDTTATSPSFDTTSRILPKNSQMRGNTSETDRWSRSRAASARLPAIEARRKEQMLKLQLLQSEIANIQKELEESLLEEVRLRADVESGQNRQDDPAVDTPRLVEEQSSKESASRSPPAEPTEIATTASEVYHAEKMGVKGLTTSEIHIEAAPSPSEESVAGDTDDRHVISGEGSPIAIAREEDGDVEMGTTEGPEDSTDSEMEEASDGYEPPDAVSDSALEPSSQPDQTPSNNGRDLEITDNNLRYKNTASPRAQPISVGVDANSKSGEINNAHTATASATPRSSFVPYETPLRYFHAYRFHPQFNKSVSGGLRSLTYSNNIDPRKELCPDELSGQGCPRGNSCQFQHFGSIQTPDDQILLQLGAFGNGEGMDKQEEYINGLRQLLTDFRNRKIKDFDAISQGIIEYRTRFLGDKSKVLPLGGVAI